ncbi:radical SAM protein [bacterium]|nr:radical SAM protein [bacterium]
MRKNIILAAYNLLKARIAKKRTPLIIGWALTNRCNWHCSYCGRADVNLEELTVKQIFSIINELSCSGTYSVNFTGGEPLLREDIGKIIDYTKRKGIRVVLTSNGSLVSQKIDEIKRVDVLILSYDGPEEVHDRQRQKGSYKQVIKAIEAGKSNNIPIKLQTVLTKYNIDYINTILDFSKTFNLVASFQPVRFLPYSKKEIIESLVPPREKYRAAINNLIAEKRKGNKHIGMAIKNLNHLIDLIDSTEKKIYCCAGIIYCRIEANGDLYPCTDLMPKVKAVNCIKQGFRNAFYNIEIPTQHCDSSCCHNRLELNSIYSFDLSDIFCLKRIFKL